MLCPHDLLPGIYLAHKPVGLTSFDVVRSFKRAALEAGKKKWALGHGGTLDPFACGLLLILSGQATRLMELIHPLPKVYEAEIEWGRETDTCDHLGGVVLEGNAISVTKESLEDAINQFLGWTEQVPPATSAKKIGGEAAYKKAHRGEVFALPPSRVYLHDAAWVSHDLPYRSRLRIVCRGGFYVRSLARDLGRAIGCGAHLSGLRRSAIGPWGDPLAIDNGQLTMDNGGRAAGGAVFSQNDPLIDNCNSVLHVAGADALPWCRRRLLNGAEADHLAHGRPIGIGETEPGRYAPPQGFPDPNAPIAAIFDTKLVALLTERDGMLWAAANLRGGV
jgi:tRNA pseudouridine55 synthase